MPRVPEIQRSKWNHASGSIVMTCNVPVEIGLDPDDVSRLLESFGSHEMALIINALGRAFNRDEMAECYSVEDLDADGKQFVDSMHYFMSAEEQEADA